MQIQECDLDFLLSAGYHSDSNGKGRGSRNSATGNAAGRVKKVVQKRPSGPGKPELSRTTVGVPTGKKKRRATVVPETLDGLPVPHIRTTTGGFDFSTLNAVEARHSGANRAIPSKRRNRSTRVEAFVEAKEIGPDFRQHVSLGGGIVSEQQAAETAVQFPQWITLRDSYVAQLRDMFGILLSMSSSLLQDDARRQHFVLLLLALRKVSTRIIGEYKHHVDRAVATSSAEHRGAARIIKKYLLTMPSSLDYLNLEPFASWIGVNPVLNPLLCSTSIAGASAAIYGNRLAFDLEMNPEELELTQSMGSVLWRVISRRRRDYGEEKNEDAENDDGDDDGGEDDDKDNGCDRDRDGAANERIKMLMEGGHTGIVGATKSRLLKLFLAGKQPIKHWWRKWRKEFNIHARIPIMKRAREKQTKRRCFDLLAQHGLQCATFRALQRRYHDRITVITFDAWKEYLKWCRRFHKIYAKSVKRVKRLFFRAMKRFSEEVYDLRRFRYNNNLRYKVASFKGLRQNVILSKFELKKRLERMSTANFVDRHTCQRCFFRWACRSRLVLKLDSLEERVEGAHMKAALVRWALHTWPVLPAQPKLTFAEKMKLRLNAAFAPSVAPSTRPLELGNQLEDTDRAQRERELFQRNDEARRQRMRNARDFALRGQQLAIK